MFTVEDYLNSGGQTDFIEIAVGSETFCIRRLNGLERLRLQDIEKSSERIIYVIGICLLDEHLVGNQFCFRDNSGERVQPVASAVLPVSALPLVSGKFFSASPQAVSSAWTESIVALKICDATSLLSAS